MQTLSLAYNGVYICRRLEQRTHLATWDRHSGESSQFEILKPGVWFTDLRFVKLETEIYRRVASAGLVPECE